MASNILIWPRIGPDVKEPSTVVLHNLRLPVLDAALRVIACGHGEHSTRGSGSPIQWHDGKSPLICLPHAPNADQ